MQSHKGKLWTFEVIGQIMSWPIEDITSSGNPLFVGEKDFREGLIEYEVSFQAVLDITGNGTVAVMFKDLHARVGQLKFGEPTLDYTSGAIQMNSFIFNMTYARMPEDVPPSSPSTDEFDWWPLILLLLIILLISAWWYLRKKSGKPFLPGTSKNKLQGSEMASEEAVQVQPIVEDK
jgi:hypothetical protein